MPRVLFLDDNPARHSTFRHWCAELGLVPDVAWTADEAADRMKATRYDLAFLDHDLAEAHYSGYAGHEANGTALARWMAGPGRTHAPRGVVVHSYNAPAAERMAGVLMGAGIPVHRNPFGPGLRSFLVALAGF